MEPLANVPRLSTARAREFFGKLQPHAVFLALTLTFGVAVMLLNPPFQAPDEGDHFYRAFQISEGGFVGQKGFGNAGGPLPVIAFRVADPEGISFHPDVKMTPAIWRKKLTPAFVDWDKTERTFCGFPHTVVYPPVNYLPQALAIFLGRHAHIGPLGLMFLARLAGFAVSIWLGYAALRWLPIYRWSALLLLLCPMSLYLFGSVAPDGVLIAGAFLLVALIVRLATDAAKRFTGREQVAVLALAGVIAVSKVVYWPLAAVALLLGWPRLRARREKIIFGFAWLGCCVLPLWLWSRIIASLLIPGRTDIPIDPTAQWHAVLADPLAFVALVVKSIWFEAGGVYQWFVGVLGWGDTPMPNWFYYVFSGGLLACLVAESSGAGSMRWRSRLTLVAAAVTSTVLIFGAQYVTWNSPGSREPIEGIEGRYFLLLAPLIALSFPRLGNFRVPDFWAAIIGSTLAAVGAVVCLVAVVMRYYLP